MNFSQLILASASPRRRDLLAAARVPFTIIVSGIDETRRSAEGSCAYALRMADEKACDVSRRYPDALVLGVDTIVDLDGRILLKPASPDDARQMLSCLSARTHTVITAFALAAAGHVLERAAVTARVTFRPLGAHDIDDYLATGEPFDKAGSYGIQGASATFVAHVDGSRDTVMGLPVDQVLVALRRQGFNAF